MNLIYTKQIIPLLLIIGLALFGQSCTEQRPHPEVTDADFNIDMVFSREWHTNNADTLLVYFNITDSTGRKVRFEGLDNPDNIENLEIIEFGNNAITTYFRIDATDPAENQRYLVSGNSMFLFLVDRTNVHQSHLEHVRNAIKQSLSKLPDSTVYISFIDRYEERRLITESNFEEFQNYFRRQTTGKRIEKAILEQFIWLAGEQRRDPSMHYHLLVCTDGIFSDPTDLIGVAIPEIQRMDATSQNNITIHAFRYGSNADQDAIFRGLTTFRQNNPGRFYSIENPYAIADVLESFIREEFFYDYRLTYARRYRNDYTGQPLTLILDIKTTDGKRLFGTIDYRLGTPNRPIRMSLENFFISLIFSLLMLFIIYFVIQVMIPYITSKRERFKEKHVVKYREIKGDTLMELCPYCKMPFEEDEDIVVKCQHRTHYECWQEHGYHCPEYGRYCKEGVEYHFDKKHAFDLKKGPFYRRWAMAGAFSGLLIGVFSYLFLPAVSFLFKGISNFMVNTFFPVSQYEPLVGAVEGHARTIDIEGVIYGIPEYVFIPFEHKISGLLMAGILLGFILTFLFSWINEYRNKKGKVLWAIIGRSFIGAITGFIAFLIGCVVCVLFGKAGMGATPHIDWIPWILFGVGIALCLSVGTTIKTKNAIIGGLISGAVSFVCLFSLSSEILSPFGMFLSFMLCSAGIGISISTIHYMSQKYFLKVTHKNKSCEIAIHKWMNESGGKNEVTIGKSKHSTIEINWADEDEKAKIHDVQAKLYIDKKRSIPCVTSLEDGGMQIDGRDAKLNYPNLLENGKSFMIGNTKFEYIEK